MVTETVQVTRCDVFPHVSKGVRTYRITLTPVDGDGDAIIYDIDLCERAYARLVKFVGRGISKPNGRAVTP